MIYSPCTEFNYGLDSTEYPLNLILFSWFLKCKFELKYYLKRGLELIICPDMVNLLCHPVAPHEKMSKEMPLAGVMCLRGSAHWPSPSLTSTYSSMLLKSWELAGNQIGEKYISF